MATAVFPSTHPTTWPLFSLERFAMSRAKVRVVALAVVTSLAFGYRAVALSTYGLSEDELNKVRAIEQYRDGHFGANAEHPMLMKLAMWGSVELVGVWNHVAPTGQTVAIESAIRLPNVLAGTLTTLVLFGLAEMLFGTGVAVVASLLWALDVNAIAINRIGKEDTFLLFFFLLAMWCYERAKRQGATDPIGAQRWYGRSGASFGGAGESVTEAKRARLLAAARLYLTRRPEAECRFDVFLVEGEPPRIEWIRDAFGE